MNSYALDKKQEMFRLAMEHSGIGMALLNPEGKWLEVNSALCKIVGYPKEELLNIDFQTITHPEDLEEDLENVSKMLKGEIKTYTMEKRYFAKCMGCPYSISSER